MTRVERARRCLSALVAVVVVESCVVGSAAFWPWPAGARLDSASLLALSLGVSAGIIIYRGWPALDELGEEGRVVLLSKSKLHHVVQFATAAAGVGAVAIAELLARCLFALVPPWPFPIGTVLYAGAPFAALAVWRFTPRLSRSIGLGVPRGER